VSHLSVEQVLRIARHVIGNSTIDQDMAFTTAGLDSIGAVELRAQLEEATGGSGDLPATLVFEMPTARQMVRMLHAASCDQSGAGCISVEEVMRIARHVIGNSSIDQDMAFTDAGLDSIGAVELRAQLEEVASGSLDLPATLLFEVPTARMVAGMLNGALNTPIDATCASFPQLHVVDMGTPVGGTLTLLNNGTAILPLIIFSSTWGNVDHYQRLAQALVGPVWGVEHSFLHTGNPACMTPTTLEEAAEATSSLVERACLAKGYGGFHALGGSYGALMAQKVRVSTRNLDPGWVIMIDPPPAGPCTRGFVLPGLILASQIVRLGCEIAGLDGSNNAIKLRMGCSDDDWMRAIATLGAMDEPYVLDADDDWGQAMVATEQLAAMGQLQFNRQGIERTKRRMDVYRKCMQLWHQQDATPQHHEQIFLVTSTGRWKWFKQVYDENSIDLLSVYGAMRVVIEVNSEHTALVQDVCMNRQPCVSAPLRAVLGGASG